jgi:hypothetical protein
MEFQRGNVSGKAKSKKTKIEDSPRGGQEIQDYGDRKSDAHAFRQEALARHQEIQPDAPLEKVDAGQSRGRQKRSHDVAVRIGQAT